MTVPSRRIANVLAVLLLVPTAVMQAAPQPPAAKGNASPSMPAGTTVPDDYVIGPDDVLTIVFWREKDLSAEVAVRPDGKISLPLLNDIDAAGLTVEGLRQRVTEAATKLMEEPTVSVVVKQINSRKVFITGMVGKPGPYPINGPTTVVQLLAMAGGVLEYAKEKEISIMRTENGRQVSLRFNYDEVKKRKNLEQNIQLRPGDTIIVP